MPPHAEGEDFAIDVDVDGIAALVAAETVPEPEAPAGAEGPSIEPAADLSEPAPELPGPGADLSPETDSQLAPLLPEAEPALDFSKPDFSAGAPEDDDPYLAPPPAAPAVVASAAPAAPTARALPRLELEDTDVRDGIPTIDGEEILEEIPGGAAAPPH